MRVMDVEATLAVDPLGVRLARVAVPEMSAGLRSSVMAAAADVPSDAARGCESLRTRTVVALAVAVAGVCLLAVTPAGATLARALLPDGMQQRLGLVEGAPTVLTPPSKATTTRPHVSLLPLGCSKALLLQNPSVAVGGGGGVLCRPDLAFADVQRQVDFAIPTPHDLPPGVAYRAGMVNSTHSAFLVFARGSSAGTLGLTVNDQAPVGGSAVPVGTVQRVQVFGSTAYFARGDYEDSGPGTAVHWNPSADDEELTWRHGGLTFDLTASSLHLSVADLVRIAESVR
jgi:hypothetical protein